MPQLFQPFDLGMPQFGFQAARQPMIPDIPLEEEEGILSSIGSGLLSGLSYVGGALNKPGRMIRGLLGGQPRELLNILPFSDAMGITDPTQEVRGADLLGIDRAQQEQAGFFSPEGLSGFATELFTDPLMYIGLGGGALTKLGQTAKKANLLPRNIGGAGGRLEGLTGEAAEQLAKAAGLDVAQVAGQRLGGHLGVGAPFWGSPNAAAFDLGPLGRGLQAVASKLPGAGAISKGLDWANRELGARFIPERMGQTTPIGISMAQEFSANLPHQLDAARQTMLPLIDEAERLADAGTDAARYRQVVEGTLAPTAEEAGLLGMQQGLQEQMLQAGRQRGRFEQEFVESFAQPIGLKQAGERIGYGPRQISGQRLPAAVREMTSDAGDARLDALRRLPTEGPGSVNELARMDVTGQTPLQVAETIKRQFLGVDPVAWQEMQDLKQLAAGGQIDPSGLSRLKDLEARSAVAETLAKWKMAGTLPQFTNHPITDLYTKAAKEAFKNAKDDALHSAIAKAALAAPGADTVPLTQLYDKVGFRYTDVPGGEGYLTTSLEALAKEGKLPPGAPPTALRNLHVPRELVKVAENFMQASAPTGQVRELLEGITRTTKAFQTVIWPANHARNQMTALFQHIVHEMYDPTLGRWNPMAYIRPWLEAKNWKTTGAISDDAARKIPDLAQLPDAGRRFGDEIRALDITHRAGQEAREFASGAVDVFGKPESFGQQLAKVKGGTKQEWLNIGGVQGAFGHTTDVQPLVRAGRATAGWLDDVNRVSAYLSKRMQGFTPQAARREVLAAHYDFSKLTRFEKDYARIVAPFYSWSRQNIPAVVKDVIERPGGVTSTAIKATTKARGPEPGFLPSYIGEGVALPMGAEVNGNQRFMSRLGLPFEDLGEIFSGASVLGMLNPLMKGPAELLTGRQWFTGRDLNDLHSMSRSTLQSLGADPGPAAGTWMDQAIMNSPLGRVSTTARTLLDPRKDALAKAVNLLSGTRLTDVNMDKARGIATGDFIRDQLRGQQGVRMLEVMGNLTPEQFSLLPAHLQQLYQLQRTQLRRQARERR
jgi:hypothetical protein